MEDCHLVVKSGITVGGHGESQGNCRIIGIFSVK